MKRRCGWLVGALAIGIAGVARAQEMEPVKPEPPQAPTETRSVSKPAPKPSASVSASGSVAPVPQPPLATATPTARPTATLSAAGPIEQSPESGATLRTAGIITGGAVLGVGVVTGILAFTKKSSWEEQCDGDHCYPSAQGDYDTGKLLANISTGTVIGGAVILAASILLLPSGSTKSDEGFRKAGRPSVWIGAGPHGGEVTGRVQF
jgi:hypothetical protein